VAEKPGAARRPRFAEPPRPYRRSALNARSHFQPRATGTPSRCSASAARWKRSSPSSTSTGRTPRRLREEGVLLAWGPLDPRSGGALLLRVPDGAVQTTLDRIRGDAPYTRHPAASRRGSRQVGPVPPFGSAPWQPVAGTSPRGMNRFA